MAHSPQGKATDESRAARVLIVDDDANMAETLAENLTDRGYQAKALASSREAARLLQSDSVDALVTDLRMPGIDGLGLLSISKKAAPSRPVIVMTAYSALDTAIESIRQGAYHYLTKPFKVDELVLFLERALDESRMRRETIALRRALRDHFGMSNFIGKSPAMQHVRDLIERVADADAPVLITGETGTGKGLVARAIHGRGTRSSGPFVTINCAALPEALLESELFGHVKGAFTGATSNRAGLLEEASGGTLFLDEIGEMALPLQAKLLHVLESGTVRAVGSNKERSVDTRIVAATHRDLRERANAGAFREDLLYRLDVVTIELPALRHRRDDLPLLVEHFLESAKARHPRSPVERLSADAMARLMEHRWPGNVRELEHTLERLVLLGRSREVSVEELPTSIRAQHKPGWRFEGEIRPMLELERHYAQWAFEQLDARKVATAEKLGINFRTLKKLLEPEGDDPSAPVTDDVSAETH